MQYLAYNPQFFFTYFTNASQPWNSEPSEKDFSIVLGIVTKLVNLKF